MNLSATSLESPSWTWKWLKYALTRGAVAAALLLTGCGGGGEPAPSQSAPAPGPNHPPVAGAALGTLSIIAAHPVDVDLTTAVIDPDGDKLQYLGGWLKQPFPRGLAISNGRLAGTTNDVGDFLGQIQAVDGRGGDYLFQVQVTVVANKAPPVLEKIAVQVVSNGQAVDIDALQGGTTFGADPEGDPVMYSVSFSPHRHGLNATGTRVSGTFVSPGAVRARITARDLYGAESFLDFIIALPGPEPSRPTLPAMSFIYDPTKLILPPLMKPGHISGGPLADTTPADNPTTDAGATLGRVLFYDKRLSVTNTHSCGSCHKHSRGFADTTAFSIGTTGEPSRRNALGLANVGFSRSNQFFSDGRVTSLEALALMPIQDPKELANSLPIVMSRLGATDFYPPLFQAAFGTPEIAPERISRALAQFLRSLMSYRAPFDLFNSPVEGAPSAFFSDVFSPAAAEGLGLFRDHLCFACHADVLQIMDRPASNGLDEVPSDPGAGEGRFRLASLHNIERTAPYMHDGRFATLREVIDHYDHGMVSVDANTTALMGPNGGPRRLNLTEAQKNALEEFFKTLTDNAFLNDPRFSDPFP